MLECHARHQPPLMRHDSRPPSTSLASDTSSILSFCNLHSLCSLCAQLVTIIAITSSLHHQQLQQPLPFPSLFAVSSLRRFLDFPWPPFPFLLLLQRFVLYDADLSVFDSSLWIPRIPIEVKECESSIANALLSLSRNPPS